MIVMTANGAPFSISAWTKRKNVDVQGFDKHFDIASASQANRKSGFIRNPEMQQLGLAGLDGLDTRIKHRPLYTAAADRATELTIRGQRPFSPQHRAAQNPRC